MNDEAGTISLIKKALWGTGELTANEGVFNDLRDHTLVALPADLLSSADLPEELAARWKDAIVQQLMQYYKYKQQESELPVAVPYVILKGSAAGRYYPRPEYRAMGDIDIMTRMEDFSAACEALLENGYEEIPCSESRHRQFIRDGIIVEVHQSFAVPGGSERAEKIDRLIVDNINPTHYLPDLVNGIVLLEHIRYHLRGGIGLRQILDWMLFVNQCLPDQKWPEFRAMVDRTDMEVLAAAVTRMCELYLGLPEHEWCRNADRETCARLMSAVMNSGNFATKLGHDGYISARFFTSTRTLKGAYRFLKSRGEWHWSEKYGYKPLPLVGSLYQLGRYLVLGLRRKETFRKLLMEYRLGRERNALTDALIEEENAESERTVFPAEEPQKNVTDNRKEQAD